MKRNLISISDFSKEEIFQLFLETGRLKSARAASKESKPLLGKTLAILLQKPSTRTVVSFAAGMTQLGGTPLILNPQEL